MYIETVTYEDFNGDTRTKDLCFHIPFIDLTDLDAHHEGSYYRSMRSAATAAYMAGDIHRLTTLFTSLICKSFGKVVHGEGRFVRPANTKEELRQLAELDELIEILVTDKSRGEQFLAGILS